MSVRENGPPVRPGATPWEYHQEAVPLAALLQVCQAAGAEGWELCGCVGMSVRVEGLPQLDTHGVIVGQQPAQVVPGALALFKRPADGTPAANGRLIAAAT